jgi:hypothetical protein
MCNVDSAALNGYTTATELSRDRANKGRLKAARL